MKYNGIELTEMLPENWNGKSREMLVWDDISENPLEGTVLGYFPQDNIWIALVPAVGSECGWQHCAEIPKVPNEEPSVKIKPKYDFMENIMETNEQTTPKPIDKVSDISFNTPMEMYQALKNLYKNEEIVELEINKDHVITRTLRNSEE